MTTFVGVIARVAKQSHAGLSLDGLFEVRTNLGGGRIARVLFTVERGNAVLLHGFLKKSQKIPQRELQTTKTRLADFRERMTRD
jgi:phage-related protein